MAGDVGYKTLMWKFVDVVIVIWPVVSTNPSEK